MTSDTRLGGVLCRTRCRFKTRSAYGIRLKAAQCLVQARNPGEFWLIALRLAGTATRLQPEGFVFPPSHAFEDRDSVAARPLSSIAIYYNDFRTIPRASTSARIDFDSLRSAS